MAVCSFSGNSDMYGIGIRIGFYLQWYSAVFASWIAASEVPGIRFSISLFTAATFLALLILTIRDNDTPNALQPVEVYIILLLTFGYYLFFVPMYIWRLLTRSDPFWDPSRWPIVESGEVDSYLNFLLLIAVTSFQLWLWFARVPDLRAQACQQYGFFFAEIQLDVKGFQILNIIFYFLLLLACIVMLLINLALRWNMISEESDEDSLSTVRPARVWALRRLKLVSDLIVASVVVAATELTIRWNKIQNTNSLSTAGQTIPLFIGIGGLIRIIYVHYNPPNETPDGPPRPVGVGRIVRPAGIIGTIRPAPLDRFVHLARERGSR